MKRRLLGPTLLTVLIVVALVARSPSGYYVMTAGGSYDVEPRLEIPAEYQRETGHLAFTAVLAGRGRWLDVVWAWLDPVAEAVPVEQIRPHGITQRELIEINQHLIEESKSVAAVVALCGLKPTGEVSPAPPPPCISDRAGQAVGSAFANE